MVLLYYDMVSFSVQEVYFIQVNISIWHENIFARFKRCVNAEP